MLNKMDGLDRLDGFGRGSEVRERIMFGSDQNKPVRRPTGPLRMMMSTKHATFFGPIHIGQRQTTIPTLSLRKHRFALKVKN